MMRIHANGQVAELACDRCGARVATLVRTWQDYPGWGETTERRELWVCRHCMGGLRTSRAVTARDMFKRGATVEEVADELGVSERTARKWLRQYM